MDLTPNELKATNDVSDISQLANDEIPNIYDKFRKFSVYTKNPSNYQEDFKTHTPVHINARSMIKSNFQNKSINTHSDNEEDDNSDITNGFIQFNRQKLKPIKKKVLYDNENNQNNLDISNIKNKEINKTRKEKTLQLVLKEKTRGNVKKENTFLVKHRISNKKERVDRFGTVINKKNKRKVKITFCDQIRFEPLINVVKIESFKKYNFMMGMPKEDKYLGISKNNCQCCILY